MTKTQQMRLSAVMISSTMPSAKYSCSGSPLILANGSTPTDGLSGRAGPEPACANGEPAAVTTRYARTGRATFLSGCSPMSSKARSRRARGVLLYARRNADTARLGQAFEPGGNIDAVAKDVAVLDDDIADIDADAELDAAVRWHRCIAFGQRCCLHLCRAAERVDDAGELDQKAIAGRLDDPALMVGNSRIDHLGAERLGPAERAFLVRSHQPRIPRHIGGEDCGETACDGTLPCGLHGASSVADDPILIYTNRASGAH